MHGNSKFKTRRDFLMIFKDTLTYMVKRRKLNVMRGKPSWLSWISVIDSINIRKRIVKLKRRPFNFLGTMRTD